MKKLLLVLAIPLALMGCAHETMSIRYTATPGTSVSKFQRYYLQVAPPDQATAKNWMIEKHIHDDLRSKGYIPVDMSSADVIVRYKLDIAEHLAKTKSMNAALAPQGDAIESLIVTIEPANQKQPIWQGISEGDVAPSRLTASLEGAIIDILDGIPPAGNPTPPQAALH